MLTSPKNGYYQKRNVVLNVPSGSPGLTQDFNFAFPFKMVAWKATIQKNPRLAADVITMTLRPNNSIGLLDSSPSIGATQIVVDAQASASVWPGTYLQFNDVSNELVQIKATSGVVVTLVAPLAFLHANATPLGLHIRIVDNYTLSGSNSLELGEKGSNGMPIDADDVIRITYTNTLGFAKTLICDFDLYTGST